MPAYTAAAGSRLTASANRNITGIELTIATINCDYLEAFADDFKANGHATSNTSAMRMNNQAIKDSSFSSSAAWRDDKGQALGGEGQMQSRHASVSNWTNLE
jgi:hypothetical protein